MKKRITWSTLVKVQMLVCVYTLSGVAAKYASNYEFMSWGFIVCYGIEIMILGIYAVLWQQVIKKIELSVAYANRSIALLWSMVWAMLFFKEQITMQHIVGVGIVIFGTMMVNKENAK